MKQRLLIFLAAIILVSGASTVFYLMFVGPRMRIQPNLRSYKFEMRQPAAGALPIEDSFAQPPTAQEARTLRNPLPDNSDTLVRGKTYYQYYCVFCHGQNGGSYGPVGFSYNPAVADLRSPKIKAYSDGQLLRAMLIGTGHDPMLKRIIPQEYRWYLVTYTRYLNDQNLPAEPNQPTSSIE